MLNHYTNTSLFWVGFIPFYLIFTAVCEVTVQFCITTWVFHCHGYSYSWFFLLSTSGHSWRTWLRFRVRNFEHFGRDFISFIFCLYFGILLSRVITGNHIISGQWFESIILWLSFYLSLDFFLFCNFYPFRWGMFFVREIFRAYIIVQTFTAFRILNQNVILYQACSGSLKQKEGKLTRAGHICWPKPTSILLTSRHLSFGSQLSNCFRVSSGFFGYKMNE